MKTVSRSLSRLALFAVWCAAAASHAQVAAEPPAALAACARVDDGAARLACYDRAAGRTATDATAPAAGVAPTTSSAAAAASSTAALASRQPPPSLWDAPRAAPLAATDDKPADTTEGCHDTRYTTLSRFWELEAGTDCGTFGLRGYRPVSISWVTSDSMNTAPSSPSPGHSASYTPYRPSEMRMQLSVRTKIAQGLLTQGDPERRDSLWFGYTQQSYWQLFNGQISRPFRATDHEPELVYVYPLDLGLGSWRLRYAGAGLVHQSNGQSLPLSRSWNRVYLMAGLERGDTFRVQARAWRRLPESAAEDDNPDISDYIGRGEVSAWWNATRDDTLGLTVRSSFASTGRGSARLEWLRVLGRQKNGDPTGLRLHLQLFTGYGDSLIDYNYRRTVFSVGLSLLDF